MVFKHKKEYLLIISVVLILSGEGGRMYFTRVRSLIVPFSMTTATKTIPVGSNSL